MKLPHTLRLKFSLRVMTMPPVSASIAGEGWELFLDLLPLGLRGLTGKQKYLTHWSKRVLNVAVWRAWEFTYGLC